MLSRLFASKYLLIAVIFGFNQPLIDPIYAQSVAQKISFFLKSPRLTRAASSFNSTRVISTYFFAIQLPEDAGNSLQSVTINQQVNLETIRFFPEKSRGFLGDNNGKPIEVQVELDQSNNQNQLNIFFSEAIKPGEMVTIAIRARNPLYGGIYQFGVTAYPQGNNPQPLYLGNGRIHFYSPGGRY